MAAFFEREQIAHPSTFERRLAEMRWSRNIGLQGIVTGLSDRVLRWPRCRRAQQSGIGNYTPAIGSISRLKPSFADGCQ
jgi:hypothetical protein